MKKDVKEIMLDVHNITDTDVLHMYFHWPYEEETAALHLHVRAGHNPPDMEKTKSFELENVIQELKKHGSMTQFLEDNMPIRESEPGILEGITSRQEVVEKMIETTGLIKKVSQDGVVADTSATVEDQLNGSLSRPQHNIQKASAEIQKLSDAIHDLDTGRKSWDMIEKEQHAQGFLFRRQMILRDVVPTD